MLGDDERVVGVVDRLELDQWVIVDVLVGRPVSHAEGRDGLAAVDGLPGVVDHPALHQLDDPVGDEFGVHPEVSLLRKVQEEGVRNDPVADLDRVSVLDELGDVFPDPLHRLYVLARVVLQKRLVMGQDVVRLFDPDEPLSVGAGHLPVRLDDHERGRLRRRFHDVHADAEAQAAVPIRQRGLDERHVDRHHAPAHQVRNLGEEDRRIVGEPPFHGLPGRVADEEGVVAEVLLELHVGVRGDPERPDLEHLGVEKGGRMGFDIVDQRANQVLGLAAARADEDPVAPADTAEHLLLRCEFLRITLPPDIKKIGHRFEPSRLFWGTIP